MDNFSKFYILVLLFLSSIAVNSCRSEEDAVPDFPDGSVESINVWVHDNMKRYYYWDGQMPSKPDYHLPVKKFFTSLLSQNDRFSSIVDTEDASTYLRTVRNMYGFDYAVLQLADGQITAVIKLVLQDSPAQNSGLQRGMIIKKINGSLITLSNAESLLNSIPDNTTLDLTVGEWKDGNSINEKDIKVYYGFTFNQPIISKIFNQNGKKTGYLYIYDFPDGMSHSLNQKFAEFKANGVKDLVVDLRYNYGGSVASAAVLCSLIPSGITADSPFIIYKGNKNGGEVKKTFAEQIAYDPAASDFTSLHANALGLNRVFILTSKNTASASEIVINNLKPYLQVIQAGGTTLGKDMAGFSITDERKPKKISWQLHPVIYKVYNADGEGEYSSGISPQVPIDEYASLPLLPLGQSDETLLQAVLGKIYSKSTNSEKTNSDVKILSESERPFSLSNSKRY
ncbi:carboxyl-terminal processing protease [Chryseobacterium sp. H1D6B]|uniref:S41 family peptidase n=1 Tax=Chryseobacterium sp. H1D6B TaxID=2940588 RepID=UPI0015C7E1BF|nr:S41 family peptidase [Chryseobacterium sp. H1D6B]MDH6250599.1 carboxyl-terminal processing protease [Chryseobacterium sp. H1D6B]